MPTDNRKTVRNDGARSTLVPQFATPDPTPDLEVGEATQALPPVPSTLSVPLVASQEATEPAGPRQGLAGKLLGLGNRRPDTPDGTPSGISSPESGGRRQPVGAAEAAVLIAGLIGVLALGAAWLVQMRSAGHRTLRKPTKTQQNDIARPLAQIASRHVPADLLHADLGDAIQALTAAGAYITSGPLVTPAVQSETAGPNPEE